MVRHCVGNSLAKCKSFSSSSRVHSVFLTLGSNHSYHLALHCFGLFLAKREATRDQLLSPYFITAALRISSSEFFHTPPLIKIRMTSGLFFPALHEGQSKINLAGSTR